MRKVILKIFLPAYRAILVFVGLGLLSYFFISSEVGLQIALELATKFIPGQLVVSDLKGSIISGVDARTVHYKGDGFDFSCDNFSIRWNLSHVRSNVLIHSLQAENIKLNLTTQSQENVKDNEISVVTSIVNYINYIRLEQVNLNGITITNQGSIIATINEFSYQSQANKLNVVKLTGMVQHYPLQGYLAFTIKDNAFEILPSKLSYLKSQITLQGYLNKNWNIVWNANIDQLGTLIPGVQGSLISNGKITGVETNPTITSKLRVTNLAIKDINFKAQSISSNIHGTFSELLFDNLQLQSADVPKVTKINANMRAKISWINNSLIVRDEISSGSASVPLLGIKPRITKANLNYQTGQAVQISGAFTTGAGTGQVTGNIDLSPMKVLLSIAGHNLQLVNLNQYHVVITPDVKLGYTNEQITLNGQIFIPSAKITPDDLNNVVALPDEVTFVDQANSPVSLPLNLFLHLGVQLGPTVKVSYQHIKAHLAGAVTLETEPGRDIRARGSIYTVKGKYTAYGKQLTIEEGRLIYAGNPILDPGLNIKATQKIKTIGFNGSSQFTDNKEFSPVYMGANNITVGVLVRGTLSKPLISLYSDTPMNQDDILSYLIFGYPRSQITKSSSLALLNSFTNNLKGNQLSLNGIKNKLQDKFGLNELDIGTAEYFDPVTNKATNTTAFNLGRKFGKRFYVHYSVGIFNPIQILNLKYQINNHLAIQSETSSVDNGADVLYELERD